MPLFRSLHHKPKGILLTAQWHKMQQMSAERISFYDNRVNECIEQLKKHIADAEINTTLWLDIKRYYTELLSFHPQAELAETFFNSVFCRLYHRKYFNNDFIFVNSTQTAQLVPIEEEYKSFFPSLKD